MEAIVAALAAQQAELSGLLSGLDERDWERPSRCEGWTVADVVLHLAQTNEMAVASARGRFAEALHELAGGLGGAGSVDDGADLMVARERGQPAPVVCERWRTSADALFTLRSISTGPGVNVADLSMARQTSCVFTASARFTWDSLSFMMQSTKWLISPMNGW